MSTQSVPVLNPLYSGNRSSSRARLGIGARLETLSGTFSCIIRDISTGGAHVIGPVLKKAQCVVLLVEGREVFAEVAWVTGNRSGLNFQPPVELEFVIALRHRAPEICRRDAQASAVHARNWVAGRIADE